MTDLQITEPGVYDMPSSVYHRDPVPGGSLSSTGARLLIQPGGPAKFKYGLDHPGEESTEAFDFGTAAHQVVLGDPEDRLAVIDAPDWKLKVSRDAAAEAREAGLTPILTKQWEQVRAMAQAILAHSTAADLLARSTGKPEQSMFWRDTETGIWCRARVDWLRHVQGGQRLVVVDYKSAYAADEESFGRSAAKYGYFVQDMFYRAGVQALGIDPDPAFRFVVQEKTPPYLVNVIELDDVAAALGRNFVRIALNTFDQCRRTGRWPGYGDEVKLAGLPEWFLRQYDEEEMDVA